MTSNIISIGEFSRLSGVSTYTIRFYETAGVLNPSSRAENGHRRYHIEDLQWLEFVLRLKRTNMPLTQISEYATLRTQGNTTLELRLNMLKVHQKKLRSAMHELQESTNALDLKIETYKVLINTTTTSTTTSKVSK